MNQAPRSSARLMIANEVFSSQPTLCMNDLSSASPNVIAPRHRTGTLSPLLPSDRYSMSRPPRCPFDGGGAYLRVVDFGSGIAHGTVDGFRRTAEPRVLG